MTHTQLTHPPPAAISFVPLTAPGVVDACAAIMLSSEPWSTLQFSPQACVSALTQAGCEGHAIHVGGRLCGFVVYRQQGPFSGFIQLLGVAADWRNQQLGAQLLAFAEERIFAVRPNVFLCVSSFNHDAKRFYLRHGYQEIGEISDYLVIGCSELLMRKTRGPIRGYLPTTLQTPV